VSNVIQSPSTILILTCRQLRSDLEQLAKSPLLRLNSSGRVAVHRTQILLEQIEDLADRVTMLEIGQASSTEKLHT
jgi:hypothetical protein